MAHQMMVDRVTAGVHAAAQQDNVADLERSHGRFVQRGGERNLAARALEARLVHHRNRGHGRIAIQPLRDVAAASVEDDAQPPEGPAVVRHGDEKAGRQTVERAGLAANERNAPAKAHRAYAQRVHSAHDLGFEFCQP